MMAIARLRKLFRFLTAGVMIASIPALQGCFTGIESTQKIKLSKMDERAMAPTAEELFLDGIHGTPHTAWPSGKQFIAVGDRGNLLFEPYRIVSHDYSINKGDTLVFLKAILQRLPDGSTVTGIEFDRRGDSFLYTPQVSGGKAREVMSDGIPGIVDQTLIEEVRELLTGKTIWILSPLWIDDKGERIAGKKFSEVKVTGVESGDMIYPLRVRFITLEGEEASVLMGLGKKSVGESRLFSNLFSLSDPKLTYPGISADNWEAIRNGEVRLGMTRAECRLAKGNPTDVLDGRDYSYTQVVWTYGDGTALHFVDGVLRGINTIAKDY